MSAQIPFSRRLAYVLIPTPAQVLSCLIIALIIIIGVQSERILAFIGIDEMLLNISRLTFHGQIEPILTSRISETAALITFWAGVGVVAYLICWIGASILAQARNELTLTTEYTNRGHWRGPYQTLGLKSAGAIGLIIGVALLRPGISFWLVLAGRFLETPSISTGIGALLAILGLATQLYLLLALVLVTFTPWYRSESFTE